MNIQDADQGRNYLLIMQVGAVGSLFLLVFGINALWQGNHEVGTVLLAVAVLTLGSMSLMHISRNHDYGTNGLSLAVVLVHTYLIASGGIDNTGPLWCYPLIMIIMLLLGFRKGVIAVLVLFLIAVLLFFYPDIPFVSAEYPSSFKIRFIASFSALAILSFIYEYMRWQSTETYVAMSRELDKASRTDVLTGLSNRRDMQDRLEEEYGRFTRHGHCFSIIMADLDHFKRINDRYGHAVGDDLLIMMSHLFSSGVRRQDVVSRWGGEEFLILLPETRLEQAVLVAEKLRSAAELVDLSDIGVAAPVTASFGVQCNCADKTLVELIAGADSMLYEAKRLGRNKVIATI